MRDANFYDGICLGQHTCPFMFFGVSTVFGVHRHQRKVSATNSRVRAYMTVLQGV